jgi:hypothetical protein
MPRCDRVHRVSSAGNCEYTAPSETSRLVRETETDLHASLSYVMYCPCFASFSPDVNRGQNECKNGKKVVLKCAIPVALLKHGIKRK